MIQVRLIKHCLKVNPTLLLQISNLLVEEVAFVLIACLLEPITFHILDRFGAHRTSKLLNKFASIHLRLFRKQVGLKRGSLLIRSLAAKGVVRGTCLPQAVLHYSVQVVMGGSVDLVLGLDPTIQSTFNISSNSPLAHAWVRNLEETSDIGHKHREIWVMASSQNSIKPSTT
jgi:hypothetical protein